MTGITIGGCRLTQFDIAVHEDASGLACPMPLLKLKRALNGCMQGQCVELIATDGASVKDIASFTELTSHELVDFKEQMGSYTYLIRKG